MHSQTTPETARCGDRRADNEEICRKGSETRGDEHMIGTPQRGAKRAPTEGISSSESSVLVDNKGFGGAADRHVEFDALRWMLGGC